jgi:hypothetical protein
LFFILSIEKWTNWIKNQKRAKKERKRTKKSHTRATQLSHIRATQLGQTHAAHVYRLAGARPAQGACGTGHTNPCRPWWLHHTANQYKNQVREPRKETHGLVANGGLHFQLIYVVYMYCNMYFGHVVLVHPAGHVLSVEISELFPYFVLVAQEILIVILMYSCTVMYILYRFLDIWYGILYLRCKENSLGWSGLE